MWQQNGMGAGQGQFEIPLSLVSRIDHPCVHPLSALRASGI